MEIKLTKKTEVPTELTFYYLWVDGTCEKCYRDQTEAELAYQAALIFARRKIAANNTHEVLQSETL